MYTTSIPNAIFNAPNCHSIQGIHRGVHNANASHRRAPLPTINRGTGFDLEVGLRAGKGYAGCGSFCGGVDEINSESTNPLDSEYKSEKPFIDISNAPHHPSCSTSLSRIMLLLLCTSCCTICTLIVTITFLPTLDVSPFPALAIVHTSVHKRKNDADSSTGGAIIHANSAEAGSASESSGPANSLLKFILSQRSTVSTNDLRREFPHWFHSKGDNYSVNDLDFNSDVAMADLLSVLLLMHHHNILMHKTDTNS